MPILARKGMRAIAMDIVGFGFTDIPQDATYHLDYWVAHVIQFLDGMDIEKAHLLGNSFGGGLALAVAARHPERVARTVLMGAIGTKYEIQPLKVAAADATPLEKMLAALDNFTVHPERIPEQAVRLRARTLLEGNQAKFDRIFPMSREEKRSAMLTPVEEIRKIRTDMLLVHGREDRVVPVETSLRLHALLPNAQLHVLSQCGHWSHVDQHERFHRLIADFCVFDA